jgi:hypothetical protein
VATTVYLDEHFGSGIAGRLVQEGAGLPLDVEQFSSHLARGATDPEHLQYAASRGWTLVSRDRDFVFLHDQWVLLQAWRPLHQPLQHAGILLVESSTTPDDDVVTHTLALLNSPRCPVLADRLLVLTTGGTWLSHHPFADNRRRRLQL